MLRPHIGRARGAHTARETPRPYLPGDYSLVQQHLQSRILGSAQPFLRRKKIVFKYVSFQRHPLPGIMGLSPALGGGYRVSLKLIFQWPVHGPFLKPPPLGNLDRGPFPRGGGTKDFMETGSPDQLERPPRKLVDRREWLFILSLVFRCIWLPSSYVPKHIPLLLNVFFPLKCLLPCP